MFFFISLAFKSTVDNSDYNKMNNKTYKTDSVDAAISKGHNIQKKSCDGSDNSFFTLHW